MRKEFNPEKGALMLEACDDCCLVALRNALDTELKRRAGRRVNEDGAREEFEATLYTLGVDRSRVYPEGMERLRKTLEEVPLDRVLSLDGEWIVNKEGNALSFFGVVDLIFEAFCENFQDPTFLAFRKVLRDGPAHGGSIFKKPAREYLP